jgi:protein subunit release factor A
MKKELLFSLTKKDFEIQTFRSGGKGGQNQNKVESGVRIIHKESGAIGESREHRNQLQNRKAAFERLVKSKEFQLWHKLKASMIMKGIYDIEKELDKQMEEKNLKIETYIPE